MRSAERLNNHRGGEVMPGTIQEKHKVQSSSPAESGSVAVHREGKWSGEALRRDPLQWFDWSASPLRLMRHFTEEMTRMFGSDWTFGQWVPDVEMFHRANEFVVRTDLPGLGKDDVQVEVTDDALTIRGERRYEHEEEREGAYHSERSYGSFCRVIALPSGAITESAKATFRNGVLEVVIPAPSSEGRGRRLEISTRS
jgi:HSP20 family protein